MDELKKYLQHNREELDADNPPASLLQRIQQKSRVNKKGRVLPMLLRIAAAACIVMLLFVSVRSLFHNHAGQQEGIAISTPSANKEQLPVAQKVDTVQQIAQSQYPQAPAQQNKQVYSKPVPVSYQLLHSFEQNYSRLVNLQLRMIRSTPVYGETQDYFNSFKKQMQQIEEAEHALKSIIKTNGLDDKLLEQLINVYQEKINLLKNLQHEIGSMNNKIKENRQPADSIPIYYINI